MWLVKKLRKELGIPAENVLRHYDIVNKVCPAPYVHNNKYRTSWTWSEFKRRISDTSDSEDTKQNAGSSKAEAVKHISEDALRRTVRRIRRKEKCRGDGAAAAGKRVYGDCEDCVKKRGEAAARL